MARAPGSTRVAQRIIAVCAVVSITPVGAVRAPDLDVAVPSGAPLEWKSNLPQRYVRPESLFALTRDADGGRYATARARPAVRTIGVVRPQEVLTLDFAGHLGFRPLTRPKRETGAASNERPYPPPPDVDLYWRTTVSLLQMLLHPARVLRLEILGQLLILGEGALPGLDAAASLGELADETRAVRTAIGPTPSHPPDAIPARDPFAALMQRLVAQELCLARPYASDFAFAERLLLLRDEIVPFVVPYLGSSHSFARRNAAALLAMLDTPTSTDTLAREITTSDDLVVRMRAVHGLAQRYARGAAPVLRAALEGGPPATLAAALIRALGELDDRDAIPLLLKLEGPARARAELLIERLSALTRIEAGAHRGAVEAFVQPWLTVTGAQSAWLRADSEVDGPAPDLPDPPDARARTVEQLARLLHARLRPDDAARQAAALAPLDQPGGPAGRLTTFPCASLGAVAPLARFDFVGALATFGTTGADRLRRIARDRTCEPELRMAAVEALPQPDRADLAAELALDVRTDFALRLATFELLDNVSDRRAVPLAEELGPTAGLELRDRDDALEHWRLLLTVQALGRRNRLATTDLVKVLESADPRRAPKRADSLATEAEGFVAGALRVGRRGDELDGLARSLLLRLIPSRLPGAAPAAAAALDADVAWLAGQAEAVIDRPRSERVRAAAVRSIADYLELFVARHAAVGVVHVDVHGMVPLLETVLMELARKADDAALDALAGVLRDAAHPARAAACLALGATRRLDAAPPLVYALKTDDPFVRLCAYLALKRLTGQDFFVDWLSGSGPDLERGFAQWGEWLVRNRR